MEKPRLLGLKDAAKILGVSTKTLKRLMDAGKVRWVWVGKRRKVAREEIDRICREGTSPVPQSQSRKRKYDADVIDYERMRKERRRKKRNSRTDFQ